MKIFYTTVVFLILVFFLYYPRYENQKTEATISWDVAGYYMYLPAFFIYDDIKQCKFKDDIIKKYQPIPVFNIAFIHEKSGNFVMKYPIGQAIVFSPFFFVAHIWASNSTKYNADGFSFPYQLLISLATLFYALIGLFFLRAVLIHYFTNWVASLSILALILGSNYLNYSVIDGAMTHNSLFTIYAILIYFTIQFYKKPNIAKAIFIGFLIGFAALIRPTEIISCLIPIFWGLDIFSKKAIQERFIFFRKHLKLLIPAIVICLMVGFIQLLYWKFVSGDWIIYSYENQGFSWLKPHILDGMFSYKSGWITYSPIMIFALIGFFNLFKFNKKVFYPTLIFSLIFMYITFAWDIWWYGGSLGQRAMVQAYPILIFPFAAFINWLIKQKLFPKLAIVFLMAFFSYLNLWFTHQAHLGGMLFVGQMNKTYYWKTLGTLKKDINHLKILDTNEFFEGERENIKTIYFNDFEKLESSFCQTKNKSKALCLNKETQHSPIFQFTVKDKKFKWIRSAADFEIIEKEWNTWKQTQFIIRFKNGDELIKYRALRVYRLLNNNDKKTIFFDVKKPKKKFDQIEIQFWNGESEKIIKIDNLQIESFN